MNQVPGWSLSWVSDAVTVLGFIITVLGIAVGVYYKTKANQKKMVVEIVKSNEKSFEGRMAQCKTECSHLSDGKFAQTHEEIMLLKQSIANTDTALNNAIMGWGKLFDEKLKNIQKVADETKELIIQHLKET